MTSRAPTARQLARETVRAGILAAARARLAQDGAAGLSLRAVARDVGMVSSAVYRYFPSRDDLLTALLVEAYDALGAAVEEADAAAGPEVGARWVAACRAIRRWSLAHPAQFALLYGSPVPGYAAPQDTVVPATRVVAVLLGVVLAAVAEGAAPARPAGAPAGAEEAVAQALAFARARGDVTGDDAPEVTVRTLMAWTTLFGAVSFELFGHYVRVVETDAFYDQLVARLVGDLGFAAVFGAS